EWIGGDHAEHDLDPDRNDQRDSEPVCSPGPDLSHRSHRNEFPSTPGHDNTLATCLERTPPPMDMLVKLYALPDSRDAFDRVAKAGIRTRRAMAPEKHKVVAWIKENFSEAWASEAEVAFSRQPVSCFIAIRQKAILGFACHDATCPNFFGPTGVAANERTHGI